MSAEGPLTAFSVLCPGSPPVALRELRRLARPLQARLLAFLRARVAREEARLPQRLGVLLVDLQQGAGDAVGDRTHLAGDAAAFDLHHGVEPPAGVRDAERGDRGLGRAVATEVLVERLAVHHHGPLTGNETHPRDGRLAASGALEICGVLHRVVASFSGWGFCAACG